MNLFLKPMDCCISMSSPALKKLNLDVKNNQLTALPGCSVAPDWLGQTGATVAINVANNVIQGPFQPADSVRF